MILSGKNSEESLKRSVGAERKIGNGVGIMDVVTS